MNEMKPYAGDVCLEARVRVIEAILEERKEAVGLAVSGMDKRLDLLNELRGGVMTKAEYDRAHEGVTKDIANLSKAQSRMVGIGITLVALSGLLGVYLGHLIK